MTEKIILIIDDNLTNLKLMQILLEKKGYEIHTSTGAEDALHKLSSIRPDLILMDIQLPGMDGLQLTSILRSYPDLKNIAIVAVTAYAMIGDEERILKAGCDGYITKPIDVHTFPDQIAKHLTK